MTDPSVSVTLNDLLGNLAINFPKIDSAIVQKALADEQANAEAVAVLAVRDLIKAGTQSIREAALALKRKLNELAATETNLFNLDRAVQFMMKTGNPLPYYKHINDGRAAAAFCTKLGIELPPPDDAAWVVPSDIAVTENVATLSAVVKAAIAPVQPVG